MKKLILFFILALIISDITLGQKPAITLTFTSAYQNASEYLQLDSVRVTNISHGVDTVLYYPDTVLLLEYITGIPDGNKEGNSFSVMQNYPNPTADQSTISIFVPSQDKVHISVTDIRGRSLLRSDWQLLSGYHSFCFTPGIEGLYFFTATWKGIKSTIKILQNGSNNQSCGLTYTGFEGIGTAVKSNNQETGFIFYLGDSLLYIGYAKTSEGINGSDVLSDKPQSDETYLFEIVEGIPCPGTPAVTYGAETYTTVQIGTQCWFKQNLNIGSMIDSLQEQTDNSVIEKYCKDDDPDYCSTYGGLYQWAEVVQYLNGATNTTGWDPIPSGNVQGICPSGWHLPSDFEWCTLTTYIDPSVDCNAIDSSGTDVGGKMKETGTIYWAPPNFGATNESGFSGGPCSYRYSWGAFKQDIVRKGNFWSATERNDSIAYYRTIRYSSTLIGRWGNEKIGGVPARCIKD